MDNKLILTSRGLTTGVGAELIGSEIRKTDITEKKIYIFHEPNLFTEKKIREVCLNMGFSNNNILFSREEVNISEIKQCDYFYIGEGNVFEILSLVKQRKANIAIKEAFTEGNRVYIGSSSGGCLAGKTISEMVNFERNISNINDFSALNLFPEETIVFPHCSAHYMKNYLNNSPGLAERYNIVNIANEDILVVEV